MSEETISARTWDEIVAHYDNMVMRQHLPYEPMRDLVRRLAESPAAPELERSTSMHTLLVSTAPARSWRENVLRVTFVPKSREFEFEYAHYDGDNIIDRKRCSVADGWDTLSRFIRYKFGISLPDAPKA